MDKPLVSLYSEGARICRSWSFLWSLLWDSCRLRIETQEVKSEIGLMKPSRIAELPAAARLVVLTLFAAAVCGESRSLEGDTSAGFINKAPGTLHSRWLTPPYCCAPCGVSTLGLNIYEKPCNGPLGKVGDVQGLVYNKVFTLMTIHVGR